MWVWFSGWLTVRLLLCTGRRSETTEWRLITARSTTAWLKNNSCSVNVSTAETSFRLKMCEFDLQNVQCAHSVYKDLHHTSLQSRVLTDTVINQQKRQGSMNPAQLLLPGWSENISANKLADNGGNMNSSEPPGSEVTVYVSGFVDKWTGRTIGGSLRVKMPLLVPHDRSDRVNWLKQSMLVSDVWDYILERI